MSEIGKKKRQKYLAIFAVIFFIVLGILMMLLDKTPQLPQTVYA